MSTVLLRGGRYAGTQEIDWEANGYPDTPVCYEIGDEGERYVFVPRAENEGVDTTYDLYAPEHDGQTWPVAPLSVGMPMLSPVRLGGPPPSTGQVPE